MLRGALLLVDTFQHVHRVTQPALGQSSTKRALFVFSPNFTRQRSPMMPACCPSPAARRSTSTYRVVFITTILGDLQACQGPRCGIGLRHVTKAWAGRGSTRLRTRASDGRAHRQLVRQSSLSQPCDLPGGRGLCQPWQSAATNEVGEGAEEAESAVWAAATTHGGQGKQCSELLWLLAWSHIS